MVVAATSSVPVILTVEGCNNNGICEASQGEDTLSCPADCHGGGGGGGGGGNYFYDITVTPGINSVIVDWKSRYPALATLKWGRNTDYLEGSISGTTYNVAHQAFLDNLLKATKYYFLIEGQNTNNTPLPRYTGTFTTLSGVDPTKPRDVTNFTATPNTATTTITLTWNNPLDPDFEYVRIMRNNATGNTSPMLGSLIYEGSLEYFVDRDVFIFVRYFYTIFTRNSAGEFSTGVEANAMINPVYIDPCALNPTSCIPPPNPCTLNPSLCTPPPPEDKCKINPSLCINPPVDKCKLDPASCLTPTPILPIELIPTKGSKAEVVIGTAPSIAVGVSLVLTLTSTLLFGALSFGEILLVLLRLWSLLLIALGLKKRTPPWGVVYDSVTKQPIDPAYVVLLDMNGNEVASCITDLDGRYGFAVEPGNYKIIVNKTNYSFPSNKLAGKFGDELYGDLYFGTEILVTKSGAVITKNIPMDPLHFDWNEFAKKDQHLLKFFRARDIWISRISELLFKAGFIFSIYAVIVTPIGYNIAIVAIYIIIFIARILGLKSHPKGSISESLTHQPLPFSIVRVIGKETGVEISHKVSDRNGRYYALVPNGQYEVVIEKKNIDESYNKVQISEPVSVKKGYLKKNFKV